VSTRLGTKRKPSPLPFEQIRAVLDPERGTAVLGFNSSSQPDTFWLRVYEHRMQATAGSASINSRIRCLSVFHKWHPRAIKLAGPIDCSTVLVPVVQDGGSGVLGFETNDTSQRMALGTS
jgi:hypothetical protein